MLTIPGAASLLPLRYDVAGFCAVASDFLLVVAQRIAPGIGALDPPARERVAAIVDAALAARPAPLRRQFALFLSVLRWAPLARYGRTFERLSHPQQDAVLRWFQDAPVAKLRHGFWGLKTLVYMGYYGRPEVGPAIGYRPVREGNRMLAAPPAATRVEGP